MSNSNLIVNYIPNNFTNSELLSIFCTIGPVESCHIVRDTRTGYSYGYGFVKYANDECAEKAIMQLNGLEIYNKRIRVSFARPPGENIKSTNLYVTNVPRYFSEDDLENLFKVFGTIIQKRILFDKVTGQPRGVAFVRFDKKDEAQNAIQQLNGQVIEGSNERLGVRLAEEHGKQRAEYLKGFKEGFHHVLHQNEVGRPLNRTRDTRSIVRKGFGRSYTNFIPFQGVSGNATNLRRNLNSNNSTFRPFQGVSGIAVEPSIGFGPWPRRFSKKQNRFNPLAFRTPQ